MTVEVCEWWLCGGETGRWAEVDQTQLFSADVNDDVLVLDVSVYHASTVQPTHSVDQLTHHVPGFTFVQPTPLRDVVKQVLTIGQSVHDDHVATVTHVSVVVQ